MTKTIEISCLFSLNLLKSQRLKETLQTSSFWSSNSIFWSSNFPNAQKYEEINTDKGKNYLLLNAKLNIFKMKIFSKTTFP